MNNFEIATIIISSLSSIGGCLAELSALITIREIRAQRVYSYRPNIFVVGPRFNAFRDEFVGIEYSFTWLAPHGQTADQCGDSGVPQSGVAIKIYNLGFGAAEQLSIRWIFDIARVTNDINIFAQKSVIPMYYDFDGNVVRKNLRGKHLVTYYWRNQESHSIDFVLPASISKSGFDIAIPTTIIDLMSNYVILASNAESRGQKDVRIDASSMVLKLEYQDIDGIRHSAAFQLSCDIHMISAGAPSGNPILEGGINSRRIEA